MSSSLSSADLFEQYRDPQDGWLDGSSFLLERDHSFLPLPIIITEPAVDGGLGMAGIFFHDNEEQLADDEFVTPSVTMVGGAYTGNGSWMAGGGHRGVWRDDSLHYLGVLGYASINLDYYGGADELTDNGFEFNGEGVFVKQELLTRIGKSVWWLGANYEFSNLDVEFDRASLHPGLPAKEGKFSNSGLGLVAEFDSRDTVFTPNTGHYGRLQARRFAESIGGDFDYSNYTGSYRGFWKIHELVIGGRGDLSIIDDGNAPFYAQPYVKLRGIPAMRYQGDAVAVLETELRWDFTPRISALGFIGLGRAENSFDDLGSGSSEVAKGLGMRYLIARKLGLRGGIDVGWGPEDTVVYITVGQSWSF